jgi:hypothetical protein
MVIIKDLQTLCLICVLNLKKGMVVLYSTITNFIEINIAGLYEALLITFYCGLYLRVRSFGL